MDEVQISVAERIARITLNRPGALNALTGEMYDYLLDELPKLARDPSVGVVVLQGAGRAFCSGADVTRMKGKTAGLTYEERVANLQRNHELPYLLHAMPKPTISRLQGVAVGAGLSLALACDVRIAGPNASFMTGFSNIGLAADFGATFFLARQVGEARAQELFLTSERIEAERAAAWGIVSKLVAEETLDDEVTSLARKFAGGARLAYAAIKRNFAAARGAALREVLDTEACGQIRLAQSEDHAEAIAAFREKRKPDFQGC